MSPNSHAHTCLLLSIVFAVGCIENPLLPTGTEDVSKESDELIPLSKEAIYDLAKTCVTLETLNGDQPSWLATTDNQTKFVDEEELATAFFMQPSDLGTYLLYDERSAYVGATDDGFSLKKRLVSDIELISDTFVSPAEWQVQISDTTPEYFQFRHRSSQKYMGATGLVDTVADAILLSIKTTTGCVEHPEMSLDAEGNVSKTSFENGDLFGVVDTHSHILSNFGFGGGGIFHGAPFHRLGVEHAMGSCELFHAEGGRGDLLGAGFEAEGLSQDELIQLLSTGRFNEDQHATDGWPTFSSWPSAQSATHQTQYYRWLERAWKGGLRVVVQHAVSNEAFCDLMADTDFQPVRWGCEDMLNVDRQFVEIRKMEAYIDAQSGGPGKGWFRIVENPAEARAVVGEGKLAVILGIEVPNLFDCYLTPRPGSAECNTEHIEKQLDKYHAQGVRVLFPNHKYDNAFSPGDGDRGIIELGNFLTTGHWSNFVEDCPEGPGIFDYGQVEFGGMNQPRDDYFAPAPNPLIKFDGPPIAALLPYLSELRQPPLPGEWCQKTGLTEAGTTLIKGMMARGMLTEIDHLPLRSYADAFEILSAANYPALGTHGNTNGGKIYEHGGMSKANFKRCADSATPGSIFKTFGNHRTQILEAGGYPSEGFGFDFNGLAGVQKGRFGTDVNCAVEQENPVTYPFESFGGDVTFTQPQIGSRKIDFNKEGMIHVGLLPELIEDARRTGVPKEDLDFIFRSAEGYIRMWELAEERSKQL